jgi:hypothetical protein
MKIVDKLTNTEIPLILWPKQVQFLDFIHNNKRCALGKKRQVLGSKLAGMDSLVQCMYIPHFFTIILSKSEPDAIEFLRHIKIFYSTLEDKYKISPIIRDNVEEIEFSNHARLLSLPANRGAGLTGDRVIIDEAAHITQANSHTSLDIVLSKVEPALDKSEGQLILISSGNGFNLFEKYYSKGKKKESNWRSFFFGCYDDPTFTPEKREEKIKELGEDITNQEYPRNDVEMFLMSGRCKFNRLAIQKQFDNTKDGEIGYLERLGQRIDFTPNSQGWITIYQRPEFDKRYIGGFDIAEGLSDDEKGRDPDYSAGIIIDSEMNVVAEMHCRFEPDVFAEEIFRLCKFYNEAFCVVERNKDGLGVLKNLQGLGYYNIYYQENFNPEMQRRENRIGWITNKVTKPPLVQHGDELLRKELCYIPSYKLLQELTTYVVRNDGSTGAELGKHDDLVQAWLLACWGQKFAPVLKLDPEIDKNGKFADGYQIENYQDIKRKYHLMKKNLLNKYTNVSQLSKTMLSAGY